MKKSENRYSIRKFSVGASSILVATLLFMGGGAAQAAETHQEVENPDSAVAQSIGDHKSNLIIKKHNKTMFNLTNKLLLHLSQ